MCKIQLYNLNGLALRAWHTGASLHPNDTNTRELTSPHRRDKLEQKSLRDTVHRCESGGCVR